MKITVFGANYIGFPLAVLLAQEHEVVVVDSNIEKVAKIKRKESVLHNKDILPYLNNKNCNITAALTNKESYYDADVAIIAYETKYDAKHKIFDVTKVEKIIRKIYENNKDCIIIVCSQVPVGYCLKLKKKYEINNIVTIPESVVKKNPIESFLHPERIVVGAPKLNNIQIGYANKAAELFLSIAENEVVPVYHCSPTEAETIKMLSNTYKIMRNSFFELVDAYTTNKRINKTNVINGILLEEMISSNGLEVPKDGLYYLLPIKKDDDEIEYPDPIVAILNSNADRLNVIGEKVEENRMQEKII